MPNQDPTQNPQKPDVPASVSFSTQSDLPPLSPDFQNVPEEKPTDIKATVVETNNLASPSETSVKEGSAAPSDADISLVIKSPKKKFGSGKIIATILGIFLLVGGVGAGILLTQQQQIFQPKAYDCSGQCTLGTKSCKTINGVNNGKECTCIDLSPDGNTCIHDYQCVDNLSACPTPAPTASPGPGVLCTDRGYVCVPTASCPVGHKQSGNCIVFETVCCDTASTPAPGDPGCIFDNYQHLQACVQVNGQWMRCDINPKGEMGVMAHCDSFTGGETCDSYTGGLYPNCVPGGYCINTSQLCTPAVPPQANCHTDLTCGATTPPAPMTPTPAPMTPTPAPKTPTPTPIPAAPYCAAVNAYNSTWTALKDTDLLVLTTGSIVNFCVSGITPSGVFDMAQFTIKGTQLPTTTTHRPSSTDFCQSYTILSTDTTVSVSALIHHSTLGWF